MNFTKFFLFCASLICAVSCSTIYDSRTQKKELITSYLNGQNPETQKELNDKLESRAGTGDELMWLLELGSFNFYNGEYKKSLKFFGRAEKIFKEHQKRAVISIQDAGAEGASLATNLNALPYRSNFFEKILVNTYKALDYYAMSDEEAAMVEIRRAHWRQKEAKKRYSEEIREAEKAAEENNFNFSEIIKDSPQLKKIKPPPKADKTGLFVNPFTSYLSAISYMLDGNFGEAAVDFRTLNSYMPENKLIQKDLVTVSRKLGDKIPENLKEIKPWPYRLDNNIVYLIFANGMIPARKSFKIQLPLPPPVGYTGFAIPVIEKFKLPYKKVKVVLENRNLSSTVIADMSKIVNKAYRLELPIILLRTFLSLAAKEASSALLVEQAKKENDTAMLLTLAAVSAYKYTFNTADTRCWQILPAEFQIVHFPKPENNKIKILIDKKSKEITLQKNSKIHIIFINAPGKNNISIKIFNLNKI